MIIPLCLSTVSTTLEELTFSVLFYAYALKFTLKINYHNVFKETDSLS